MAKEIINSALQHYSAADYERMNRLPMFSYASNQVLPAVFFKLPLGANGILVVRTAEDAFVRHAKIIEHFANELGLRAATLESMIISKTRIKIASSNTIQVYNYNKSGNVLLNDRDNENFMRALNSQLGRISQVPLKWQVVSGFDS